jgi:hypothetical protein
VLRSALRGVGPAHSHPATLAPKLRVVHGGRAPYRRDHDS